MALFDIKNQTFREVMGNDTQYEVPRFQRDYSWKEEQWEDLWEDILKSIEDSQNSPHRGNSSGGGGGSGSGSSSENGNGSGGGFHYMGYLVLQPLTHPRFIVIDGQQRLTTLSILILALLRELDKLVRKSEPSNSSHPSPSLDPDPNQKRLNILYDSFIGVQDATSLLPDYKLSLNRNNDDYFKTYLCDYRLEELPVPHGKPSEKLMRMAFGYFQKKVRGHFSSRMEGEDLAQFIANMAINLHFTSIIVNSEVNAYTIFETLNARGVQLSTPDLVKNYIFSLIDNDKRKRLPDRKLQTLESKWNQITEPVGENRVLSFIRAHWNSQNTFSTKSDLFKKIRKDLKDARGANSYLDSLLKNSPVYAALRNEEHAFWKQCKEGAYNDRRLRARLGLLNLFKISTPHGALLMAFHKLKPKDFVRLLYYIESLSVRYNIVCGKNPSPQERLYAKVAQYLRETAKPSLRRVVEILKKIMPSDREFEMQFEEKTFKTGNDDRQARYFLHRVEHLLNEGKAPFSFADSSVEHILPKNPSEEWIRLFENKDRAEEWAGYLGNMTLLSVEQNKGAERKNFEEKKKYFEESPFKVTQQCLKYEEWNEKTISERQKWLGKKARELWRFPS